MKKTVFTVFVLTAVLAAVGFATHYDVRQTTLGNLQITIQEDQFKKMSFQGTQAYSLREKNLTRDRNYTFYSRSMLMIFVGTSDYPTMSKSCGSRVFYFFPYKTAYIEPSFTQTGPDKVEAILPSGHKAEFSTVTGELTGIEGYKVTITSPIAHFDQMVKSKGGVEIAPEKGSILLDCGWSTGGAAYSQLWRTAEISDGYGSKCNVKMSDLFVRTDPNDPAEVAFKFNTNEEFDAFLSKKCPKIKK